MGAGDGAEASGWDRGAARGGAEKMRDRPTTPSERRLVAEIQARRLPHFTRGRIIGSRAFIDGWFEANRGIVKGRSRAERKRGSKPLGKPALRGLYAFRAVK